MDLATYYSGTWFHGCVEAAVLHPGICLAERDAAGRYGSVVTEIAIDLRGLRVVEVASGYDPETNTAPGDDGVADADVIVFGDSDPHGRSHQTVRLMTAAALARATIR